MTRIRKLAAGLLVAGLVAPLLAASSGCGGGGVKEELIEVKPLDPMVQVRSTLQNYAKGQPVASEATSFDYMVAEVRKTDAAKADTLKAGLDEIKALKGSPAAKAIELMKKLGIEPKGAT